MTVYLLIHPRVAVLRCRLFPTGHVLPLPIRQLARLTLLPFEKVVRTTPPKQADLLRAHVLPPRRQPNLY